MAGDRGLFRHAERMSKERERWLGPQPVFSRHR